MTLPELVQLYAPLAGMLAMAFWLGVLQERVRSDRVRIDKLEAEDTISDAPAVVRLDERVANLATSIDKLTRGVEGVQRQLGNIMTGKSGQIIELKGEN